MFSGYSGFSLSIRPRVSVSTCPSFCQPVSQCLFKNLKDWGEIATAFQKQGGGNFKTRGLQCIGL